MMDKTSLGNRMKRYEQAMTRRIPAGFPICIRIDGRSFSKFTKGSKRPYDCRISKAMEETTKYLVMESGANAGYCQSDEISLVLHNDSVDSQVFFDGKVHKLVSVLASLASVKFYSYIRDNSPELLENKNLPIFDCRVWMMPSKQEVINYLIWRNRDAVKNSISMASSELYSHKELHKKTQNDRLDMMIAKGVNWNDYPRYFKEGVFVGTRTHTTAITEEQRLRIPSQHRTLTGTVTTNKVIDIMDGVKFSDVENKIEVIFDKSSVELFSDDES